MENIDEFKIYCFLTFIVLLIVWKFWKDGDFKSFISAKTDDLSEGKDNILKEIEALSLELNDNSKKIESLTNYLKRLDQNASRLADDIRASQASKLWLLKD